MSGMSRASGHALALRLAIASAAGVIVSPSFAAVAPIYGGLTYNPFTDNGYVSPEVRTDPGVTAGNGYGVAAATKYISGNNVGTRAMRFTATGTAVELEPLGTAAGYSESSAAAVNASGVAVGTSYKFASNNIIGTRATRWVPGQGVEELGGLGTINGTATGFAEGSAFAVNNLGTAVGYVGKYDSGSNLGTRAVRWNATGSAATELDSLGTIDGTPTGTTQALAIAINTAGTSVGYADKYVAGSSQSRGTRAVRWDATGTAATELGTIGTLDGTTTGFTANFAQAISTSGTVVGYGSKYIAGANKGDRAIRWDASGTAATELGTLGTSDGTAAGLTSNYAYSVNNAGTAVGSALTYASGVSQGYRAVRWDGSGTAATALGDLTINTGGTPIASRESKAHSISNAGVAVGYALVRDNANQVIASRAVAWGTNGTAVDLNTLLSATDASQWTLTEADSISDAYYVTGIGEYDQTGPAPAYTRTFLLDVISIFGLPGDATRDSHVNFDDLIVLAQHYNTTTGGIWDTGDFTADGAVNFDDLIVLAQHYNQSIGSLTGVSASFAADWALAQSLVPEPTALLPLGLLWLTKRQRNS